MSLFLCLFDISPRRYCRKSLAKSGGGRKKYRKEGDGYIGGLSIERGLKPSTNYGLREEFRSPNFVHVAFQCVKNTIKTFFPLYRNEPIYMR